MDPASILNAIKKKAEWALDINQPPVSSLNTSIPPDLNASVPVQAPSPNATVPIMHKIQDGTNESSGRMEMYRRMLGQ